MQEFEAALKRTPGVVPADALEDAREFLIAEIEQLSGNVPDEEIRQRVLD